jgi:metallo-beta-lactamase class B
MARLKYARLRAPGSQISLGFAAHDQEPAMKFLAAAVALALLAAAPARAQSNPDGSAPIAPFRITGNIYYVGAKGIAAYLIAADRRLILLDVGPEQNAPLVENSIKALGFHLSDVKIILNSHAHYDHAGGIARLKRDTGAMLYASPGDRWALEHGTHDGETFYPRGHFPPVRVDHVLKDEESVALGGVRMTATFTPGHTRGCTTWSTQAIAPGRVYDIVFPCSLTVAGNRLIGNKSYPDIVRDYERSFDRIGAMKADIVLTAHPEFADVLGREARVRAGQATAFVDPTLLGRIVKEARADFLIELKKQRARRRR